MVIHRSLSAFLLNHVHVLKNLDSTLSLKAFIDNLYRTCYTVLVHKIVHYLFIQLSEFSFSVQGLGTGEFTE